MIIRKDAVTNTYVEYSDLLTFLLNSGQVSYSAISGVMFSKLLTISIGSYFETELKEIVEGAFNKKNTNRIVIEFSKKNGFERKFHTWFSWEKTNANSFFSMFGNQFAEAAKSFVIANKIEIPIKNFMEIGRERNRLVHENILIAPFEKTLDEVFDQYLSARIFVDSLPYLFNEIE